MSQGALYSLLACSLFATHPVFVKYLLAEMDSGSILALQYVFSGIVLIVLLDARKRLRVFNALRKEDTTKLISIAVWTTVLGPAFLTIGLAQTSAINALLIGRAEPFVLFVLAALYLGERMNARQVGVVILMCAGIAYLATQGFAIGVQPNLGDVFVFVCAFSYSAGSTIYKKYLSHINPEVIVVAKNVIGGLVFLPLVAFIDLDLPASMGGYAALAGVILLSTVGAQLLWYKSLTVASAQEIGFASMSLPFFGIAYAWILLGESLAGYQIVGGCIIVVGLAIARTMTTKDGEGASGYTPKK